MTQGYDYAYEHVFINDLTLWEVVTVILPFCWGLRSTNVMQPWPVAALRESAQGHVESVMVVRPHPLGG